MVVCDAAAASPSAHTHQATGCRSRGSRALTSGAGRPAAAGAYDEPRPRPPNSASDHDDRHPDRQAAVARVGALVVVQRRRAGSTSGSSVAVVRRRRRLGRRRCGLPAGSPTASAWLSRSATVVGGGCGRRARPSARASASASAWSSADRGLGVGLGVGAGVGDRAGRRAGGRASSAARRPERPSRRRRPRRRRQSRRRDGQRTGAQRGVAPAARSCRRTTTGPSRHSRARC